MDSRVIADRLGADRYKFGELIRRNAKFLNDFGRLTPKVDRPEHGGRPGKHYMLNFQQMVYIALRTETESGRRFARLDYNYAAI